MLLELDTYKRLGEKTAAYYHLSDAERMIMFRNIYLDERAMEISVEDKDAAEKAFLYGYRIATRLIKNVINHYLASIN